MKRLAAQIPYSMFVLVILLLVHPSGLRAESSPALWPLPLLSEDRGPLVASAYRLPGNNFELWLMHLPTLKTKIMVLRKGNLAWALPDSNRPPLGKIQNNLPTGPWNWVDEQGRKLAEALCRQGQIEGELTIYEGGRRKQQGLIRAGKKDALWTMWFSNGQLASRCNYQKGLRQGPCSKFDGQGRKLSQGLYEQDKKTGWWQYHQADGQIKRKVKYVGGKTHGQELGFHAGGGKSWAGSYFRGRKDGYWIHWRKDGSLESRVHFKRGLPHGPTESWHPNGQRAILGTHDKGKKQGRWQEWTPNGKPRLDCHYLSGELSGLLKRWHSNGQLAERAHYKKGRRHGQTDRFSPGKQRIEQAHYRKGQLHGRRIRWNPDGSIRDRFDYVQGKGRKAASPTRQVPARDSSSAQMLEIVDKPPTQTR